jgi:DNA-binding winged helix-turn-helix (wHTH) protein/predicted Zn-dependent protease
MGTEGKTLYEFGPFRVDPDRQLLLRENQPVALTPKAFETLLILIRHHREMVSKDDLMKELWPDSFVEEANLSQNIFMLRKALGDTPEAHRYIVTIPGRGYRFATEVRTVARDGDVVIASHTRSQLVLERSIAVDDTVPALRAKPPHATNRTFLVPIIALLALAAIAVVVFVRRHRSAALGMKDSVLVADFTNTTGDPVFDDTLRRGLIVQLEQSPFLSLVSEDRVRQTLQLMGQPPEARLDASLARQVCERTGSAAILEGSIATLGSQYVLGLRATNCRTGDLIDEEQVQAATKEDALSALSQIATKFRTRIGESLTTVKEHDTPLAEATTSSLEALQAYSIGWRKMSTTGDAAALPFFQRALQLDPKFAMDYASLGRVYGDLGEAALSGENTAKAYDLRDHASDREKFWITASYNMQVKEDLNQAQQICGVWAEIYPRDPMPHVFLSGAIYPVIAKYSQAIAEATKARELDPDFAILYFVLASRYQELGDLEKARQTLLDAEQRKLEIPEFLLEKYDLAFLRENREEMARIAQLGRAVASADEWLAHQASVLAYSGRAKEARETAQRAADLAQQAGHMEAAALYEASAALWEGFFGDGTRAKQEAKAALALSKDRGVEYGAAFALVLAGDSTYSRQLADDLEQSFPEDTSVQFSYLPALRARLALNQGEPSKAIDLLQKAVPYELGRPRSALHANFGALYPIYVRGEAYLALHQGAAAAAEFQKILDHRGIVVSDPIGALAHLQLGRAYALQGDMAQAKAAYRDFLTLWKDADPDVPVLKEAKAEFERLR